MKNIILITVLIFSTFMSSVGQIGGSAELEARARTELKSRGLDEDAVRARLEERGIDVYSIDSNNPVEMLKAQKAMEEVLAEMEAEKIASTISSNVGTLDTLKEEDKKIIAKQSEEVSEAVEDGSSLEEAVSETLSEDQTRELPKSNIYGQEVFRSQSIKFYRQSKDVKPPASYVLGVGDIIALSIWGASEESQIFEINEDGYIKPTGMSRVYLKGILYGEAKGLLRKKFQNYYNFKDNQFEISLNFSRTINVSVVGEVYNFGSFNIPAINTAFNALVAAGGPNDIGSVRKIQLLRTGQQPKVIDVYEYLNNPATGQDFFLEENDIINVPIAEKLVTISGAVKRPFTYELLKNENLIKLIEYARGLKPIAMKRNIQVIRYENDEERIIDVNLQNLERDKGDFTLMAGDRVIIQQIPSSYDNFVQVSGAVEIGGKYAFIKGEKIADLVKKFTLTDDALLELSYLKRLNEDRRTISYIKVNLKEAVSNPTSSANIELVREDVIVILRKGFFVDESTFNVTGAVRSPSAFAYDYNKSIRVSDALFMTGGLRVDATNFGYIKRVDPDNPKQKMYIKIDLEAIQEDINSTENVLLEARDELIIKSLNDYTDELYVTIEGYVRNPGQFVYDESLNLEDVLLLSGGLSFEAAENKIDIYRVDIEDNNKTRIIAADVQVDENLKVIGDPVELKPYDEIIVRRAPEFALQQNIVIEGNVKYPGKYALLNKNERLSDLIKRAGGLTDEASIETMRISRSDGEGFIVADFEKAVKKPGSLDDIILQAGDLISIPKMQNLVTITGYTTANVLYRKSADFNVLSVPYEKGKNAKYYINKYAAGIAESGSKNDITVTEVNGKVKGMSRFLFFRKYPEVGRGSVINVGEKIEKPRDVNDGKNIDWGNVFSSSVAQATSVLTLILLLERLD